MEQGRQPASRDERFLEVFTRVNNAGRWGAADELGTLNYITPAKRQAAARLVQTGESLSLAVPIAAPPEAEAPGQLEHRLSYHNYPGNPLNVPASAEDFLGIPMHHPFLTHLDCLSHIASHDGLVYNNRRFEDVAAPTGITHGSIYAQRHGILSRGVLLDIPAALGLDWLEPSHEISPAELEAAERLGDVRVGSGDVLVLRTGVEAREAALGADPLGPGPGPEAILWIHEREVAVYTGDAPDHITIQAARILGRAPQEDWRSDGPPSLFPLPLHQIGLPAMGLVLLDHCHVEELAETCRRLGRYAFLFVAVPLALPGGTGSPVNPIVVL